MQRWWGLLAFKPLCSPARDAPVSAVPGEVAILAATGDQGDTDSVDFSDHGHKLAQNPEAARFLGNISNQDTFLILFLWELWMGPCCHSGIGICFMANQWRLMSAAQLAIHPSPPSLIWENIFVISCSFQPKPGSRRAGPRMLPQAPSSLSSRPLSWGPPTTFAPGFRPVFKPNTSLEVPINWSLQIYF